MNSRAPRLLCLLVGLFFFPVVQSSFAEESSGLFLQAYQDYQAAEKLEGESDPRRALLRYREAETRLAQITTSDPEWQPLVVEYRLKRTRENIARLETQTANMPPLEEELEGPLPSSPERETQKPNQTLPQVTTKPNSRANTRQTPYTPPPAPMPGDSPTLANALRELTAARKELLAARSENNQLGERLEKANADLKSALFEVDRTKVSVVELKSQLAQATDTIENLKKDGGTRSEVRAESEKEIAIFLRKLAEANADTEILREENEALLAKLERASGIISASEEIRKNLLAERQTLSESNKSSSAEMATIQSKLVEAESRIEAATKQATEAEEKLAAKADEQNQSLEEEKTKAKAAAAELAALKTENTRLEKLVATAKAEGADKSEIERLSKENEAMTTKLADAEKRISSEGREIAVTALQSELNSVNDKLLETQGQIASREKRIEELVSQLDQTSADLARLKLLPEPTSDEKKMLAENDTLRTIILRQIKMQNLRDEALRNLETELTTLKVESETLNVQLAVLGSPVLELNPEERALFKDPVALLTDPDADRMEVTMAITKPTEGEAIQNIQPKIAEGASELTDSARENIRQAQQLFNEKNYAGAEKLYLEIAQNHPDNYFVLSNLGAVQIEAGKPAAAEVALSKAITISPEDSFAQTHLGIAFSRQGHFDNAQEALTKAIELNPSDAVAYNYLGVCLAQKGDRNSSEVNLKKSIELDPTYANAHFNLAVLYATGKPPSLELAKQHYQLATKFGAPPDASLEQLIQ